MSKWLFVLMATSVLLTACGGPQAPKAPEDLGQFQPGETVQLTIEGVVHVCEEHLPYSIVQVTDSGQRSLMLEHSCLGIAGTGVDQFCESGEVKFVVVAHCTDVMLCDDQELNQTVRWDQQEYVQVSEDCAGREIYREIQQQVPPGRYQVVVQDWIEDHVENRVYAEFTITE